MKIERKTPKCENEETRYKLCIDIGIIHIIRVFLIAKQKEISVWNIKLILNKKIYRNLVTNMLQISL